jgi:hypothetical protein
MPILAFVRSRERSNPHDHAPFIALALGCGAAYSARLYTHTSVCAMMIILGGGVTSSHEELLKLVLLKRVRGFEPLTFSLGS